MKPTFSFNFILLEFLPNIGSTRFVDSKYIMMPKTITKKLESLFLSPLTLTVHAQTVVYRCKQHRVFLSHNHWAAPNRCGSFGRVGISRKNCSTSRWQIRIDRIQRREGNFEDLVMASYYYSRSTENIHKKFISTAKFIAGFSLSASHR